MVPVLTPTMYIMIPAIRLLVSICLGFIHGLAYFRPSELYYDHSNFGIVSLATAGRLSDSRGFFTDFTKLTLNRVPSSERANSVSLKFCSSAELQEWSYKSSFAGCH